MSHPNPLSSLTDPVFQLLVPGKDFILPLRYEGWVLTFRSTSDEQLLQASGELPVPGEIYPRAFDAEQKSGETRDQFLDRLYQTLTCSKRH